MNNRLLIVFGKPGAGKSFVAEILAHSFGYTVHDGDDDIPPDMKQTLMEKREITDEMRKRFLSNMMAAVRKLARTNTKLVLHQTLLKEYMRNAIRDAFPDARFLLVETSDTIREQRYLKRQYFNLGLPYLRLMSALFDPPGIPHETITNNIQGASDSTRQLTAILGR